MKNKCALLIAMSKIEEPQGISIGGSFNCRFDSMEKLVAFELVLGILSSGMGYYMNAMQKQEADGPFSCLFSFKK